MDDQPLVRAGIRMLLAAEPDVAVVGEAGDGDEALTLARQLRPDVVVMDLRMPGKDGVQGTQDLVAAGLAGGPDAPGQVLVLTTYAQDAGVDAALRAGACGFLLKSAVPDQLLSAVRAVASGQGWLDPAITRRLIGDFAARPAEASPPVAAELTVLTAREREILVLVAEGLSNAEIADRLVVGIGTVKTHVSHLLTKLDLRDRAQLVRLAYQSGMLPSGQPPR